MTVHRFAIERTSHYQRRIDAPPPATIRSTESASALFGDARNERRL
jgi:hypothetical protein